MLGFEFFIMPNQLSLSLDCLRLEPLRLGQQPAPCTTLETVKELSGIL